ncbi:MAG: hypothetical protein ACLF0G_04615 [Candidatus Brocadiia bacterium]
MFRYRMTAYYEDKATETHVAQTVVALAEDDQRAIEVAKSAVAHDAVQGKVRALKVLEKEPVTAGVKFRSDPYIPFHGPEATFPPRASGRPM